MNINITLKLFLKIKKIIIIKEMLTRLSMIKKKVIVTEKFLSMIKKNIFNFNII